MAVTSSVSSRMPLREERKVLSTAKPSSPAAVPASGGRSRRLQALNISRRPTGYSPPLPPAQEGKQEDGNLVGWGSRQEQERHCEEPASEAGRPAVGPRRRRLRGGGGGWGCLPRWDFTQLPRVHCWGLHWSPGGTWKRRGGEEGRGQLSSYLKPDPAHPPRRKGGGEGGGLRPT